MARIMAHHVGLGLVLAGLCVVAPKVHAQVPNALARPSVGADLAQLDDDVPPPTAYDRMLAEAPLGVQPETQGLMHLAGRLFAALIAVVALIYASLKFLLPRYFKKWSQGPGRELRLIERLSLDGHNAVVMVEMRSGARILLGTGEHGVQFLTGVQEASAIDFRDTLAAGASLGDRPREDGHAAEH